MGNIFDILLNQPLGMLMRFLYGIVNNYALAIFLFALAVKIVLLPLGIKQQKGQIKMAKIKPKEQAIRDKYAGRKDSVTQQKMNAEVMDMYKKENHSPMAGCLPILVQLPILFALFGVINQPLTYIARFTPAQINDIKEFVTVVGTKPTGDNGEDLFVVEPTNDGIENLTEDSTENSGEATTLSLTDKFTPEFAKKYAAKMDDIKKFIENNTDISENFKITNKSRPELDIIKIFNLKDGKMLTEMKSILSLSIPAKYEKNLDFGFFGKQLTSSPAETGISILLLIVVLNFAASFLQMKLQKVINASTVATGQVKGMQFMEYAMPLLIVYMSYTMTAALGLYWVFQSLLGIAQMLVLAKVYPLPVISEEEYEKARIEYGTAKKKKKKKPVIEVEYEEIEDDDDEDDGDTGGSKIKSLGAPEIKDEKYISKTIPKGINQNLKNNYKKSGKKYTIKKKKDK